MYYKHKSISYGICIQLHVVLQFNRHVHHVHTLIILLKAGNRGAASVHVLGCKMSEEVQQVKEGEGEQKPAEQPTQSPEAEQQPEASAKPEGEEAKEEPKPKEEAKPEERSKPKEEAKPEEEPKPKEEAKPEEEPKPVEEEQQADPDEPEDDVPRVLVTGASGYIATHLVQQLLQQGRFRVRGTVRSLKREEKVKPLRELVSDCKYPLRLIEADLNKPHTWAKAVNGCTYVFHVASPFPIKNPRDIQRDLIDPAVNGTKNVLKACAEAGTVKRVVLTSSVAAVSSGATGNRGNPAGHVYSEKDWSTEASCTPYERSKLLAEQAAWDYVKELEEGKQFELTVVNPGYVQGPLISAVSGSGSKGLLERLLGNKAAGLPNVTLGLVDVRDVAAAHIAAIEKSEAAGNRYLLVAEAFTFQQIARIVSTEFKPQGYKVPTKVLPKAAIWMGKWLDSGARSVYKAIGKSLKWNNEKMKGELGIEPRPVNETIIDACYNLIDFGIVKKTRGYLGHPSTRPVVEDTAPADGDQKTETAEQSEEQKDEKTAAEEKPQETAPEEKPQETAAEEKPQETAAEDKPQETAAEDKPQETAAEDKPQETAPEDKPQETAPEEKPQETAAEDKPQETAADDKPQETAVDDKPQETAADDKPQETAADDKPQETAPEEKPQETTPEEPQETAPEDKPQETAPEDKPQETAAEDTEQTQEASEQQPSEEAETKPEEHPPTPEQQPQGEEPPTPEQQPQGEEPPTPEEPQGEEPPTPEEPQGEEPPTPEGGD